MIRLLLKHRRFRVLLGIYLGFWLLTSTVGNYQINNKFDEDFRYGTKGLGSNERVEIMRIENFDVRDPFNPKNDLLIPKSGLFRHRSWGVAIGPFIVIDEVATVYASLGGFGGLRVNFWFFGTMISLPIYSYWNA